MFKAALSPAPVKIGDSEARIKSLYAGRVVSTPHKYATGGHYLTVTPPGGGNNRIIFETDGKVVTDVKLGGLRGSAVAATRRARVREGKARQPKSPSRIVLM